MFKITVKFSFSLILTVARKMGFDDSDQKFEVHMTLMIVINGHLMVDKHSKHEDWWLITNVDRVMDEGGVAHSD